MLEALLILAAYLLGSISSAIVVCKLLGRPDPRAQGSGNPGATNVLRVAGRWAAAAVLVGDLVKGLLAVVIATFLTSEPLVIAASGLAAFLGHLYPIYFDFRGGKGVATALGVLLGVSTWLGLAALVTWLTVAAWSRLSSLAAIVAAILTPVYGLWLAPNGASRLLTVLMSALLLWRHQSNIRKLLAGTEPRIGEKGQRGSV